MKKIVLLTTRYPYGYGENFIEAEMNSIPADSNIEIVPYMTSNYSNDFRKIPNNVTINKKCTLSLTSVEKILATMNTLISKDFWKSVSVRWYKDYFGIKDFITVIGYFNRSLVLTRKLEKYYSEELKRNTIVFYSYWLLEGAYAISLLKKKYGCKVFSRAHRVDIFDGQSGYNVIPAQELAIKNIDKVFVCSNDGKDYLKSKFPSEGDVFECSYLGTEDWGFNSNIKEKNRFTIVSCARIEPVKRVYLLARALKNISEFDITWIHFGDGSERAMLESEIVNMPANITVQLKGTTKHEEVMKYYATHNVDLFINTSNSEGLPVSIMEAISFGIPIIATDVGGTNEIVNYKTGILLKENFASEELAEYIRFYCRMTSDEYNKTRERIRAFWIDNFSASNNYNKFYEEISK